MNLIQEFHNCKPGQLIELSDLDLLIELDAKVKGTLPSFLIKLKRSFDGIHILTLDHIGSDLEYVLVAEYIDDALDVKLFKQPDFFVPQHRRKLEDSDYSWMLDENLDYPEQIYCDELIFDRQVRQEVYNQHTAIIQWSTDAAIVDYLILLIETGINNPGGGWVEFLEGRMIHSDYVKL